MAKLSYKVRKALPKSDFALPGQRKYPIQNISHGRAALSRLAQKKSHLSASQKAQIKRAVHKKYPSIGKSKKG